MSCIWKFSLGLVLLGQPVPVMADGQTNDLVLENKHVQFVISGNNGTILKAKQKDSSQWVFTGSCDYYKAINEDGENRTRESKDEVVSSQKSQVPDGYIVRLECTNSGWNKIKLRIIKEYKIWDKEPIVTKHTTFVNEGEKGFFIETWTSVQINPEWLEGGHFYLPYPHSQPEIPVPEENKEEMILSAVYAPIGCLATAAINKNRSILAASYTYEANGVFCMPVYVSSLGSSYTGYAPRVSWQGWRHFSYRDYIKPHGRSVLSVNYTIIPDNSSGLYKQWVSLPAYKKIESPYPVPDWLEDVKLMMFPYPNPDELFDDEWRIQRLVELSKKLPDTYIMPVFNSYGYASGEFPLYADYQIKLKKGIEKYHSLSPYIKLGTYIIPQYVYAESQIMKEHPEWAVRDKEGKYQETEMGKHWLAQPAWENFRQYYAESIGKVFDNWKLDYLYIDIVHSGFGFCFDWGNHMVTQPKDYYLLWRGLLDAVKARGNDKVLFCNTPNYPLQEAGFCEMGGGLWGANSPDYNWSAISDALYYSKIFQTGKNGFLHSILIRLIDISVLYSH